MTKSDISQRMLAKLQELGYAAQVHDEEGYYCGTVDSISGVCGAVFYRSTSGRVLTANEIKSIRFVKVKP